MIRINDDFVIIVDAYNYTLSKDTHSLSKEGKPIYKSISHHRDVTGALNAFRREYVRKGLQNGCMTLETAYKRIVQSDKEACETIERATHNFV